MASKKSAPLLSSHEIVNLLAVKHAEDVFVPECKDGPSFGSEFFRIDGLAFKKSWANPCVTGYEIKVSRSDFQRDEKWRAYLPCCNELYFVCPKGLIQPEEIPDPAGLYWANPDSTRLFRKKRAAFREIEVPESVYRYILFSRAVIRRNGYFAGTNEKANRAFWQEWLKEKKLDWEFGRHVSSQISNTIRDKIDSVDRENRDLKKRCERIEEVEKYLETMGLRNIGYVDVSSVRYHLEELQRLFPAGMVRDIERLVQNLRLFGDDLERLEEKTKERLSTPEPTGAAAA